MLLVTDLSTLGYYAGRLGELAEVIKGLKRIEVHLATSRAPRASKWGTVGYPQGFVCRCTGHASTVITIAISVVVVITMTNCYCCHWKGT